ncbi:MAG: LacI family DNA-binding transcriptional regulator [Bacillaceae bacterium]|nr:LacI family DNA-binding transcriptional regulator [Bacillaceae bacterium]
MAVTIKDVAKLANVAPSTVSRVIANSPRISHQTKERVNDAMKELGYHPNLNARSLANKSTKAIGIVLPNSADVVFQNPFFPEVLRGISTKAHEEGYVLYLSTGQTSEHIYEDVTQMVQGKRVDGVILLYSHVEDPIIPYLKDLKFPFSLIGKPFKSSKSINYVDNNNFSAAKRVTEYLISLGHKRIAFVGGNLDLVVTIDRLEGYEAALRKKGIPYRDDYVVHEQFLKEGGQEAVVELMSLQEPPTALVVADDVMTLGVYRMLNQLGLSVPNDISIISFNNLMVSEISVPPMTTVDINIFGLGYEATNLLIEQITNPDMGNKNVTVPYELVIRESCKKLN